MPEGLSYDDLQLAQRAIVSMVEDTTTEGVSMLMIGAATAGIAAGFEAAYGLQAYSVMPAPASEASHSTKHAPESNNLSTGESLTGLMAGVIVCGAVYKAVKVRYRHIIDTLDITY